MADLFDPDLRVQRRNRAARIGTVDFLHQRAIEDMLDRLAMIRRPFETVLLLGCPTQELAQLTRATFPKVELIEPAEKLASLLDAKVGADVDLDVEPGRYDLILSLGTLAEANDPAQHLLRQRFALAPDGLALGAFVGGASLPALRSALRAADAAQGMTRPHVHPRIDPASLTQILTTAGFKEPVVDVDRVTVRYPDFDRLVDDLRRMAATNVLADRHRTPLNRPALEAARSDFSSQAAEDRKTAEIFEVVHFAGWQESAEN
ncbi:methyltransferase domain-containing protein [Sphingomicrobium clamense]|uniref:Class I SAM-dependent methyltransferase n=1 Tax=Sphingomicrobium clamense TaxID=2851013 RepID=A0ABS6V7K6_9SPHN|nr:methyltransferase domain-containing protein [Sphingomicrobium sp. B8]MBW0145503.1 class I SAM-dependent methyltransferase [Sphingomicrobium sp. B8]